MVNPYAAPNSRQVNAALQPEPRRKRAADVAKTMALIIGFACPAVIMVYVSWLCFGLALGNDVRLLNIIGPIVTIGGHAILFALLWVLARFLTRHTLEDRISGATRFIAMSLAAVYGVAALLSWFIIFAAALSF